MTGKIIRSGNIFYLNGRFSVGDLKSVTSALKEGLFGNSIFDFKDCESIDTSIAARVWSIVEEGKSKGNSIQLKNLDKDLKKLFTRFDVIDKLTEKPVSKYSVADNFEDIGDKVFATWKTLVGLISFTIQVFKALFSRKARTSIIGYYMEQTGVMAIPIIVALNWLMGVVLGYQAGYQMSQFGGELFMPALLAYSICWEIAPMMTAVLVAGRSGSAFAAEIGTMKVRQEIDALEVMGFNLYGYIVTPKLIALFFVMPLLITVANIAGIAGGLTAGGIFLKMPAVVYIAEVRKALIPFDLYWGVVKSLFYSTIISVTGSFMGMRVRGGAAAVGKATTSAVVVSIFLVILTDALLSLVFIHLRPGLQL